MLHVDILVEYSFIDWLNRFSFNSNLSHVNRNFHFVFKHMIASSTSDTLYKGDIFLYNIVLCDVDLIDWETVGLLIKIGCIKKLQWKHQTGKCTLEVYTEKTEKQQKPKNSFT